MSNILKDTAWLFTGSMIGRVLRAILLIIIARILGAGDWGAFSLALSIASIFTMLSDMGVNSYIIREGVKDKETRRRYFASALLFKLPILILFILLSALIVQLYNDNLPGIISFLPPIIFIFIFDSLRDLLSALSRAVGRIDLNSKCEIVSNVAIFVFSLISLYLYRSAVIATYSYALGIFVGLLFIGFSLRKEFERLFSLIDAKLGKTMFLSAWSFGLVTLMSVITVNSDALILGFMTSSIDVGLYSAALRPIQFLYLIPSVLASAIFPSLSKCSEDKEKFAKVFHTGMKLAYFVSIPLTVGGFIVGKDIMLTLYGADYSEAISSFLILILTMCVAFPSLFITNALFVKDMKKNIFNIYFSVGVLGNIILDIIFIKWWGIAGSAFATLIIQSLLFVYISFVIHKEFQLNPVANISKIIIASLMMGGVVFLMMSLKINIFISIFGGIIVYGGLLALFKEATLNYLLKPFFKKIALAPEWQGEQ